MKKTMQIGELAQKAGVPVETIRYYEREGLLGRAERGENNYRLYTQTHYERLLFIRHCRGLDMTQEEIRTLLSLQDAPDRPCGEVDALLKAHIQHVGERIAELQRLKRELTRLGAQCGTQRVNRDCGILSGLASKASKRSQSGAPKKAHVRMSPSG